VWKSKAEIREKRSNDVIFTPDMDEEHRQGLLRGWKKAVGRSFDWVEHS
jgi:glycerol kinase